MNPRSQRNASAPASSREAKSSRRRAEPSLGKVSLIGSCAGDSGLLTLRAAELIQAAEVVVVDNAARSAVVGRTNPRAEVLVSEEIFDVPSELSARALAGAAVAYVMDGNLVLFGRAARILEAFAQLGVRLEIVPGIPSFLAAASYAGLPLSQGVRGSIGVATDAPQRLPEQMRCVQILDPAFEIIMQSLLAEEHEDTPVAVSPWPYRGAQPTFVTTLGDLIARCRAVDIVPPFVLFVGEQVLRQHDWFETQPLFGARILVARAYEQAASMSRLLRSRGALPLELPLLCIAPPEDPAPLASAVRALAGYDAVAFTSANGVDHFFAAIEDAHLDARAFGGALVAAIGPGTERALSAHGVRADLVAEEHRGEGLATSLLGAVRARRALPGSRILLPRAAVARSVLPEMLRAEGALVDDVPAYRTMPPSANDVSVLREVLTRRRLELIALTSSSTVNALCDAIEDRRLFEGITFASIGPVTSETARKRGLKVEVEAKRYTVPALVDAIEDHVKSRRPSDAR